MRAPRRVPWVSKDELGELYELLFAPSADVVSKQRGLARIQVYLASPSCPAFLPMLHSLMTASLLPSPPTSPSEGMSTRMACAMSIVRFVNGMVDPLQTGPYARPISHLAASLGIPPMLISIRHRATHEDLPPLPLLVNCVNMAMDYLHHYAFLPLLATTSEPAGPRVVNERAAGLVSSWKRAMKVRIRDKVVGEENETGKTLRQVKRDLRGVEPEDIAWALCENGLVPVARRKRPSPGMTSPPPASLSVWGPLIEYLAGEYPGWTTSLAEQLVGSLETPAEYHPTTGLDHGEGVAADLKERRKEVDSTRWCLTTWLLWLWAQGGSLAIKEESKIAFLRRILSALISGDPTLRRLHAVLAKNGGSIGRLDGLLPQEESEEEDELHGLDIPPGPEPSTAVDITVEEMERRLYQLENRRTRPTTTTATNAPAVEQKVSPSDAVLPPGWTMLAAPAWREAPIGIWASG